MLQWKKCTTSGDVGEQCLFKKPNGCFGVARFMCKDDLYISISEITKLIDPNVIIDTLSLESCF